MRLSDLYLDRYLYRDNDQSSETQDSTFASLDSSEAEPTSIPSGGAAQDINTGNVQINGAQLEPGTYPTTTLNVSNWGWTQSCAFTSADADTVTWGAGTFTSADGNSYSIDAGTTGNMTAKTYIYLSLLESETEYQTSTTSSDAVGIGKVLIGVAEDAADSATYNLSEATQIVGDNILANTIDASKITTGQLIVGTNVGIGTAFPTASAGNVAYLDLIGAAQLDTTVIVGGYIKTSLLTADNIVTGTLNATLVSITNLAGSALTNDEGWTDNTVANNALADAAQAISDAATAQATADGKVTTFYQDGEPTAEGVGDLWVDTNDGNKLYRWSGAAWIEVQDDDIAQAISDASNAQATADGKIVSFYQDEEPTAEGVGDFWTDTNDDNKLYRWNGANWISIRDAGIAAAISAAADAQSTADGKIITFYQDEEPTGGESSVGDLWIDTNDGNKLYRYSGAAWVESQDDAIAQALSDASTAQSTADGKIVSFYATTAPTAEGEGDLWFDTDDSMRPYRWSGAAWIDVNNPTNWADVGDDGNKPENNATVGANWSTNLSNIPGTLAAPSGAGLYLGASQMGYYDSSNWKTYMDSSGNFYLGGTSGKFQWTASTDTLDIQTNTAANTGVKIDDSGINVYGQTLKFLDTSGNSRGTLSGTSGLLLDAGSNLINYQAAGHYFNNDISGSTNDDVNCGTSSNGWAALYLGTGGSGGSSTALTNDGGTLKWNGAAFATGTVTSIATSGAITGGTITTTGTITHSTANGYIHLPSSGTTYQMLRNSGSGTGSWTSAVYVGGSSSYYWWLSSARIWSSVDVVAGGSLHATGNVYTGGVSANEGSVNCARVIGDQGYLDLDDDAITCSTHFNPTGAGTYNQGSSTAYWAYINTYEISKQGGGGFGVFDDGVELQDGRIVSDTEALLQMKPHSTKKTDYGTPIFDMETIPKCIRLIPKDEDGKILPKDEDGNYYSIRKKKKIDKKTKEWNGTYEDIKETHTEGERVFATMSIMIGAIRELTIRLKKAEDEIKTIKKDKKVI